MVCDPINKAKITFEITQQIKWFMEEGKEEEKSGAKRMLKQYEIGILFFG